MLATSENVLFPGHNHLQTTDTDDPPLPRAWAIIKVFGHQHRWLAGGYDLEIGHFQKWLAWWLPDGWAWWIVAFWAYYLLTLEDSVQKISHMPYIRAYSIRGITTCFCGYHMVSPCQDLHNLASALTLAHYRNYHCICHTAFPSSRVFLVWPYMYKTFSQYFYTNKQIYYPWSKQFRDPPTYTHQPSMQQKVPFSLIRCSSSKVAFCSCVEWGWHIYNIVESESDPLTRRAVDLFEKEPLKGNSEVHLHTPTKFGEDRSKDLGGDREQTDRQTNRQTDKRCSIYSMMHLLSKICINYL